MASPTSDDQLRKITRNLLERYVRENNIIVRHQIDSFDDFALHKLEQIITGFNPIDINEQYLPERGIYKHRIVVSIENPTLMRPTITEKDGQQKIMMPNDARLRNMTYSSQLMVDVNVVAKVLNMDTNEYQEESRRLTCVSLGKIPIMVRSRYCNLRQQGLPTYQDECRYDPGGYFIINGNEKTIIAQGRIAENKVFVFVNNKATPYSHVAEVRSVSERRFGIPKTTAVKLSNRGNQFGRYIRSNVHHMKHEIPVFILFRALGIESDKDIVAHIVPNEDDPVVSELAGSMDEASGIRTRSDAIAYLTRFVYNGGSKYPTAAPRNTSSEGPAPGESAQNPMNATRPVVNKYDVVMHMLEHELFPHIGTDLYLKAIYLGYMVKKLIRCYMGEWPLDDRDSYVNKRIDTPGILLANLFRQYYAKTVKDMRNLILKDVINWPWRATNKLINVVTMNNVYKLIKPTVVESGLKYGLATGNWGVKSSRQRQGVAQVLNRMTYMSTLSHLRRINTPIEKTGKLVQPRKLHPTQWGVICPSETPEGASVGLVKNLAMTTTISIASSALHIRQLLTDLGIRPFKAGCDPSEFMGKTFIFVNGSIIGVHDDPPSLYHALKRSKRSGRIHVQTGIVWNIFHNEIAICTEGGRCCRPLYIIGGDGRSTRMTSKLAARIMSKDARESPSWAQLVLGRWRSDVEDAARQFERLTIDQQDGLHDEASLEEPDESIIEYMDVEEANCAMIAMSPSSMSSARYTHMELDPSLMLGAIAGTIPFSDHNQAPRNTYQAAMGKQAISVYASNFRHRYDTVGHVLNYPQRPLVSTQMASLLHGNDLPSGINAIVAIATYTGFNQEDSVIMNRSAIERGLFVSTVFKTYREQNNKNHSTGEEEFFCRPDETTLSLKPYNYKKLSSDGFVPENTFVDAGDVIIGKCMPQKFGNTITNKDTSVVLKSNERGYVDRNCHNDHYFTNVNGDGYTFAKVRIRHERNPTIGDKFSCYTDDHDVLTEDGWIPVAELSTKHHVASLVDGRLVYQAPAEVQKYAYAGRMYSVESDQVSLMVTPNHRMYVKDGEKSFQMSIADDVAGRSLRYKKNVDEWDTRPDEKGAVDIDTEGGRLPAWVWSLSRLDCQRLMQVMYATSRNMTTGVADDFQRLCLHAGYACNMFAVGDEWRVSVVGAQESEPVVQAGSEEKQVIWYEGHVYCCTVPEGGGVIYVRRNGKPCWSGNSRHGQKGTMGMSYRVEDMPFSADGLVPDIIINPHAIPSRMTIGQLMECILGTACVHYGSFGDATPFTGTTVEHIGDLLQKAGHSRMGNHVLYNSRTGEQITTTVFMGPTYYQRLKHMVEDKIHSRSSNGPVVLLTRQPAEGRARDGGLRLGEMEIECQWSHGMLHFLKERFMECSDNYRVFTCRKCGMIAVCNPDKNIYSCRSCANITSFAEVRLPYACKLLLQEIHTMGIGAKFITE